jgi:hypothetical protein
LAAANLALYNNPQYSRKALAGYYQDLSAQLSPSSIQAKRYRAIAEAIEKGQNTYYFMANKLPAVSTNQ